MIEPDDWLEPEDGSFGEGCFWGLALVVVFCAGLWMGLFVAAS